MSWWGALNAFAGKASEVLATLGAEQGDDGGDGGASGGEDDRQLAHRHRDDDSELEKLQIERVRSVVCLAWRCCVLVSPHAPLSARRWRQRSPRKRSKISILKMKRQQLCGSCRRHCGPMVLSGSGVCVMFRCSSFHGSLPCCCCISHLRSVAGPFDGVAEYEQFALCQFAALWQQCIRVITILQRYAVRAK
jgi:hypothetical protein